MIYPKSVIVSNCSLPSEIGSLKIDSINNFSLKQDLELFKKEVLSLSSDLKGTILSNVINRTEFVIENILININSNEIKFIAAKLNGKLVGVCSFSKKPGLFLDIEYIVVHPLLSGLGHRIIEYMTQVSFVNGKNWCLRLYPINGVSDFYKELGFIQDHNWCEDHLYMKLDPKTSEKWFFSNGKYKLILK